MANFLRECLMWLNREVPTRALVKRGMKVGKGFNRQQGCFLDPTHCYLITIGDDVTMSIRVTVLTHDASIKKLTGYTKLGEVKIGDRVFIGADSVILPGVHIGDDSVIGAGSVVTHDVPAGSVAVGNPAQVICDAESLKSKYSQLMNEENCFNSSFRMGKNFSAEKRNQLIQAAENGVLFIE